MTRNWRYEGIGALVLDGQGVALDRPCPEDPQGIVALVEHDVEADGRLSIEGGAIRYIKYGWLRSVLDRPHPMARQALLEGANVGVYIHRWDDPMAAASMTENLVNTDLPPWNLGIRR
ncbi:hypothetical protein V8J82_05100 [Gymnodinialimonas sp. 2305UL16-5]|uniref:hypothetical protein n=1 Tax=Gymnodinialimonas mytili TaxID=3126503 RepID=UPI0030B3F802